MDIAYIVVPSLLLLVVLTAVWVDRFSVPIILVALAVGIIFGSDVLNVWHFDDVDLTNQVATVALVFILFQGGFATKRSDFKAVALPAGGLATWGVILTALATFGVLWGLLGWSTQKSILLAAIISSTDAAAIFSILRRRALPQRLSSTLEIESAANDPMAILLTTATVEMFASGEATSWTTAAFFVWKFTAGPAVGWLIARAAMKVFNRLNPQDRGYYYVLLVAIVLLTYGVTEKLHASGMLAAFTAGFVMGNRHFVYKQGVKNFSAALSTIANVGIFVLMGLLVFPRQWGDLWLDGVLLFLVLTFVARPAAVWLGLAGMKFDNRSKVFISWAGLRGAVPIVLATYPMTAEIEGGQEVFNLVFFAVLLSILIQGSTLGTLARRLRLSQPARPMARYGLELVTMARSEHDLIVVDLPDPKGKIGPRIRDLKLPSGAVITLITRDNDVLIPKGSSHLQGWDQVTVLARATDAEAVRAALLSPFEEEEAVTPSASLVAAPPTEPVHPDEHLPK
jgi:cell volume regulation protein A